MRWGPCLCLPCCSSSLLSRDSLAICSYPALGGEAWRAQGKWKVLAGLRTLSICGLARVNLPQCQPLLQSSQSFHQEWLLPGFCCGLISLDIYHLPVGSCLLGPSLHPSPKTLLPWPLSPQAARCTPHVIPDVLESLGGRDGHGRSSRMIVSREQSGGCDGQRGPGGGQDALAHCAVPWGKSGCWAGGST